MIIRLEIVKTINYINHDKNSDCFNTFSYLIWMVDKMNIILDYLWGGPAFLEGGGSVVERMRK